MTSRRAYNAAPPRGQRLEFKSNVEDYIFQLTDKDFPPHDVRINNKRLLFIYPVILEDDVLDDLFGDYEYYVIKANGNTYVAVNFGKSYRGDLYDFGTNLEGEGSDNPDLPDVKTIFQTEWPSVENYFISYKSGTDTGEEVGGWKKEVERLVDKTDNLIHWYYDPIGGTGKTRLANKLENENWLVHNDIDKKLIFTSVDKSVKGIIFDLDKTRSKNIEIYHILSSLKDGRLIYDGKMIKFSSLQIIVLADYQPVPDYINSKYKIKEIK